MSPFCAWGRRRSRSAPRFRKNRGTRTRATDWTQQFQEHGFEEDATAQGERISGKGELTRQRTVRGAEVDSRATSRAWASGSTSTKAVCRPGRVLASTGLRSEVRGRRRHSSTSAPRGGC